MTSGLNFRSQVMDFFLTLLRDMTYDLIVVAKFHASRSRVTEGKVKQSSPGKKYRSGFRNLSVYCIIKKRGLKTVSLPLG